MQALIDFLPLLAFVVAYYLRGVYFATGVLMVAMPLMLLASWLILRKVSSLQLLSTALVLGFGALTLFLRDPRFIQWKPTIFLWGVAVVFLVSAFVGREPLVKRFLAPVASDRAVTPAQWRTVNWAWIVFYVLLGAVNLVIARNAPERVWVNFKVFGLTAALMVFVVGLSLWLQRLPAAADAVTHE